MKKRMFPKDVRLAIRAKLTGDELGAFNRAMVGKLVPTEEQLQRWKFLGGYYRL